MSLVIKIKNENPDAAALMRAFGSDWQVAAEGAHNMWVMRVLEYITRFSRVDTGRSRAGWFNFMDLNGYDYHRSLPPAGTEMGMDEGRAQGQSISEPFLTTIINNVNYVEPMNRRYGLFGFKPHMRKGKRAGAIKVEQGIRLEDRVPLFEQYGVDNWNKFVKNAKEAYEAGGRKFKPGPITPVENDPPMTF
jgi:hypothetical protein